MGPAVSIKIDTLLALILHLQQTKKRIKLHKILSEILGQTKSLQLLGQRQSG